MKYIPLNAASTEAEKETFCKMVASYGSEMDAHQNRCTPCGIFPKWANSMINIQGDFDLHLELCCDGDLYIGFIYGKIDYSWHKGYIKDGYGHIMEFYVLPEYRRRGYGRKMYLHLEELLRKDGAKRLYLTADPVTGATFWTRFGFAPTGEKSMENNLEIFEKSVTIDMMDFVIHHYDALIGEGNDPVFDPAPLREYMDKWDGQAFIDAMELDQNKSVLEIGVGTGRLAVRTAPLCGDFCGIDISPKTIERARYNLAEQRNVSLICGDFLSYEFDRSFDVVYSSLTFMHIEDKQRAIDKIADLMNCAGRLVLSIDKNPNDYIDNGTRRIKVYPDKPDATAGYLRAAGLTITDRYDTEFAKVFVARKE